MKKTNLGEQTAYLAVIDNSDDALGDKDDNGAYYSTEVELKGLTVFLSAFGRVCRMCAEGKRDCAFILSEEPEALKAWRFSSNKHSRPF